MPDGARRYLHIVEFNGDIWVLRVHENANTGVLGYDLPQQFEQLRIELSGEKAYAGDVAVRSVKAGDKAKGDRIAAHRKDDWDGRGRRLGRKRRNGASGTDEDCHRTTH